MRVIGVIPARWGSTRLPGKSLISICGKPLIQWVVENARKARCLDSLIVATDDQRIFDAVAKLGACGVMTSPDHPSGTDRVAEVADGRGADIVINIQGDEPLVDPGLLDRLACVMGEDARWDMATAAAPVRDQQELADPSVVKVVCGAAGRALYFSRSVIPYIRDNDGVQCGRLYRRHLGIYAYRTSFLQKLVASPPCDLENAEKLEQLRALHIGANMVVLDTDDAGIGVDTPEDVKYVEALLNRSG
jgi:3-deoxy-manno-octulosonate cytidylyltransferase (CMP-KDO synthetase)